MAVTHSPERTRRIGMWIGFATIAVIVAGLAVWQLASVPSVPSPVPGCAASVKAFSSEPGGTWALTKPSDDKPGHSSALCRLWVTSPDGKFTGSVLMLLARETDDQLARDQVQRAACAAPVQTSPGEQGQQIWRQCVQQGKEEVAVDAYAAGEGRFTQLTIKLKTAPGDADQAATYAADLSQRLIRRALTLPAED